MTLAMAASISAAQLLDHQYVTPFKVTGYQGGELQNFPVLVRLQAGQPEGFSYGNCRSDGTDIFFMDSDGTVIPHEIDTWNPNGESCIWVKLPTMNSETSFTMCYGGNAGIVNDPSKVWSAYAGVWHMNENASSQTDRTGNGLTATTDDWAAADYAAQAGTLLTAERTLNVDIPNVYIDDASSIIYYNEANLKLNVDDCGRGATAVSVSFAYGTSPDNLDNLTEVKTDAIKGDTVEVNLTGLNPGTIYYYEIRSVNNATPAREGLRAGTFSSGKFTVPEIESSVVNKANSSVINVLVKTPGGGSTGSDIYISLGTDGEIFNDEVKAGEKIGAGEICSFTVNDPTPHVVQHYKVRAVGDNGLETVAQGSFNPGIKWYFDEKNKRLTNTVGWKIACEKTTINGVEGYNIPGADAIKTHPVDAEGQTLKELDLTGAIDTDLSIISLGGYLFRVKGLTKLHLPDTLIKISGFAFDQTGTIVDFEPRELPNLVALGGRYTFPQCVFNDGVVKLTNRAFTTYPGWTWYGNGNKTIYFGQGFNKFEAYSFDSQGSVDLYLTGYAVPDTLGDWHRGTSVLRVNAPIYSDEWKAYVATSAADPTESQLAAYQKSFPDGRELWKVGRSGQTPNYKDVYICKWAPEEYTRSSVHVVGNIPAGTVYPAYGLNSYMAQDIECSAPATATYDGVDYTCMGYSIEKMTEYGWTKPVTNLNVTSFTLKREQESSYRITWIWDVVGYSIDMVQPESGTVGSVVYSPEVPASGSYRPGTEVMITATIGSGFTGEFSYWEGDVPEEKRYDNPLTVTMDQARTLHPVFATEWQAVKGYETTRITDGYWTLKISTSGSDIAVAMDCMSNVDQPHPIATMDLRKPVADGRRIVEVKNYAYRTTTAKIFTRLRLPDTLVSIGQCAFQGQSLTALEPALPDSLMTLEQCSFQGMAYTGDIRLMNENYRQVNFEIMSPTPIHSIYLGLGFDLFGSYGLRYWKCSASDNTIYLHGYQVPKTGSYWRDGWATTAVRVCVPIYSDEWKEYLAASAADPTAAQQNAYAARYTDGIELFKVGKSGQSPDYSNMYICKWAPEAYCVNALHVRGTIDVPGVAPEYGIHTNAASSIACSAPATAEENGIKYVNRGYVLEKLGADGWEQATTNSYVESFTVTREEGETYRVTWLWELDGYAVDIVKPESGTVGDVTVTPASRNDGYYTPGEEITVTPSIGAGWNGVFSHWEGDVPEDKIYDNPLVLTVDSPKTLHPVFATKWKAVEGYETTRITDGYWMLNVTTDGSEIIIGSEPMKNMPHPHPVAMLDLRKPVEDGRKIVSIGERTFTQEWGTTHANIFSMLRLPDTLASIGRRAFYKQPLRYIEPNLPSSVITIGEDMFGGDNVTYLGSLKLLNPEFTTVPSNPYGWNAPFTTIELGTGVATIGESAFRGSAGNSSVLLDVILHGNVPVFGNNLANGKTAGSMRFFFPRARFNLHDDWDEFCTANLVSLSEAELETYYSTFGEDAPAPAGWWTPKGSNKQYVVRFNSKYDINNGTIIIIR